MSESWGIVNSHSLKWVYEHPSILFWHWDAQSFFVCASRNADFVASVGGIIVNEELEGMLKEAVMAWFIELSRSLTFEMLTAVNVKVWRNLVAW